VLDVASGPGGKATGIAERLAGRGRVIAAELNAGRLRLVIRAAARLGCANLLPVLADARRPPFRSSSFDRVLVDAPCSGLGVLRRRPEARWRLEPEALETLGNLQLSLVLAAAALVRKGGTLVYSVCTLSARETTVVADAVRARLPMFHALAPPPPPWRPMGPGAMLLPQDAGTDGMFVLGLRRDGAGGRG
jgi:16S rRNA (cytosine967-C5)-methyltransferase